MKANGSDATLEDPDGGITGEIWEWERSSDGVTNWSTITGATFSSHVATEADLDHYLRATVRYTDAEGSGKSAETVSLNPVYEPPDHAPYFAREENFQRRIVENLPIGTPVGEPFRAFDADGHEVTLFIVDPPEDLPFELDPVTGQLRTTRVLDYEQTTLYSIFVAIHDAGHDHDIGEHSADSVGSVVILVENILETDARLSKLSLNGLSLSPEFSPDRYVYTASVPDALEQTVVDASAIDPSSRLTYYIGSFSVFQTIDLTGTYSVSLRVVVRTEGGDDIKTYEVVLAKPGSPKIVTDDGDDGIEVVHDTEDAAIRFEV